MDNWRIKGRAAEAGRRSRFRDVRMPRPPVSRAVADIRSRSLDEKRNDRNEDG